MAWSSGAIRSIPYVRSYEDAHKLFEKTAKPRGKDWTDTAERPLYNARSHHYRLVQRWDGDAYDVVLYATPMARYFRPEDDGKRVVCYDGHDGKTASNDFRWQVLGIGWLPKYTTTEGVEVCVPVGGGHGVRWDGRDWAAKLVFNKAGKLLVEESDHCQMYQRISNEDDKERRKALKERIANVVLLTMMRLPEIRRSAEYDQTAARPFKGAQDNWRTSDAVKAIVRDPETATPQQYEAFFQMAQKVFDVRISKRAYAKADSWHASDEETQQAIESVTDTEFKQLLERAMLAEVNADRRSGKVYLPKFMPVGDFPNSNRYYA
jgi:hypothetical protein